MLDQDINENRFGLISGADQDVRLMRTQPLVDITLFGYLQEREIKPVENRFRQGIAQEIPGIPHLGKRQMEERVVGLVGLFHTRYNEEIETADSKDP